MIIHFKRPFVCKWIIIINCFSCKSIAISNWMFYHCEGNLLCKLWREKANVRCTQCTCVCLSSVNFKRAKANKINVNSIMCVIFFLCMLTSCSIVCTLLLSAVKFQAHLFHLFCGKIKILVWLIFMRYTLIRMTLSAHIRTHTPPGPLLLYEHMNVMWMCATQ